MSKKKKKQQVFGLGDLHQLAGFDKPKSSFKSTTPPKQGTEPTSSTKPNIGWLFFKDYYQGFDFSRTVANGGSKKEVETYQNDFFKAKNTTIFKQSLKTVANHLIRQTVANPIELATIYPGLATGTGITHESKSQGEIKLGFSFDHTTGVPYIPASSVKGLLRSVFPQKNSKKNNKFAHRHRQYLTAHLTAINVEDLAGRLQEVVQKGGFNADEKDFDFIDLLEKELFEGEYPAKKQDSTEISNTSNWEWMPYSIYKRDIFHDAYPASTSNQGGKFLGSDFITPHTNPLKNPIPIQFMKILPNVTICFQFLVRDGLITAAKKLALFENLLKDLGIGAKTNVGYGQLVSTSKTQ